MMLQACVAFIPTSQSASDRHLALRYNPSYSPESFRAAKPSRMAASVIEDIHSRRIAEYTQKQLTAGLSDPVRELSVISDDIYLMRNAKCPAILVECGFLSNPRESALLRSESYQTRLALCIACACAEYTKEWEKEYGQGIKG